MMNYRLEVFRSVAESQSISKAARLLHLSQPAVSKHVQQLEETLGVPLFIRSVRGMDLTPAGLVYLQHVREIAAAHEAVAQRLQTPAGILTGRLRLGTNKTILSYYLPKILARFKKQFPSVTCEVTDGNTDTIIGALLDQRIDLALIEGPCHRTEIQKEVFFEDEIIWIAAPSHPLAQQAKVTPAMVIECPIVVREVGAGTRQFMESALRRLGIRPNRLKIVQEIPSPAGVKRLVSAGLGIGYAFRLGVEQEIASGILRKIHCPKLTIRGAFSLLFRQGPSPSGVGQAFKQMLLSEE